jgi:nucleotide-binding universal stress UspA family protein
MRARNILLAVDASANAMRAVQYTGEMIGNRSGFTIELLVVEKFPDRDLFADKEAWIAQCQAVREALQAFLDAACLRLQEAGVPAEAIGRKYLASSGSPLEALEQACRPGATIADEILREVSDQQFGTVVVGRRGVSKAEEFLFGSVSTRVIQAARGCAVWVVE